MAADTPATLEPDGLRWSDTKHLDGTCKLGRPLVWDFICPHRLATSCASYTILSIVLAEYKMRDKYHNSSLIHVVRFRADRRGDFWRPRPEHAIRVIPSRTETICLYHQWQEKGDNIPASETHDHCPEVRSILHSGRLTADESF